MNEKVGKKIRELRHDKNLSQEYIADFLNISRSAYQRIENGDTNSWVIHIEKICSFFNVSLEFLISNEER